MGRHDLSDAHFKLIEPFLPVAAGPGHPWNPHRPILNGSFWRFRTGCQWRDLPERYGPWQTIDDRYVRWRRAGTWDRILQALQVNRDAQGKLDWEHWSLESTSSRAHRAAAGARTTGGATPRNPTIMPEAARVVASGARSTCSAMAAVSRSRPCCCRAKPTNRPTSSAPWTA